MLGAWVKERRLAARLTQAELATQLNIAQPHVSRLELDQFQPTLQLLAALARAFTVPFSEVLRVAWPSQFGGEEVPPGTIDPLAELPPDVVARLLKVQPHLLPEDWEGLVADAIRLAAKNAEIAELRRLREAPQQPEVRILPEQPATEAARAGVRHLYPSAGASYGATATEDTDTGQLTG